jgi:hypothetical protein
MAEWDPRSTTPFSESYTPPTRAHSLAPSTRWRSRSRSRVASSSGSSPPPEEDRSDPEDLDGEYEEEEEDSPYLIYLQNLPEPEDRGRQGKPLQGIPKVSHSIHRSVPDLIKLDTGSCPTSRFASPAQRLIRGGGESSAQSGKSKSLPWSTEAAIPMCRSSWVQCFPLWAIKRYPQ